MAIAELAVNLIANTKQFDATMKQTAKQLKRDAKTFEEFGSSLQKASLPLVALGASAMYSANQFDSAFDKIRASTGATGETLEGLKDTFADVFSNSTQSADEVASVISQLNARLGLTGEPLRALSEQVLQLAETTGQDLNGAVENSTHLLNAWNISASEQGEALNTIFKASQETGVGFNQLADEVTRAKPTMDAIGFSFKESTALLAQLSKEGANTAAALKGLETGYRTLAKEGVQNAGDVIKSTLEGLRTGTVSTQEAITLFGGKASTALVMLAKEGKLSIDALMNSMEQSKETISGVTKENRGFEEALKLLKNAWISLTAEIGKPILEALASVIQNSVIPALKDMLNWWKELSPGVQKFILGIGAVTVVAGPMLILFSKITFAISALRLASLAAGTQFSIMAGATGIGLVIIAATAAGAAVLYFKDELNRLIEVVGKSLGIFSAFFDEFRANTLMIEKAKESVSQLTGIQDAFRKSAEAAATKGVAPLKERIARLSDEMERAREVAKRLADRGMKDTELYKEQLSKIERLKIGVSSYTKELDKQIPVQKKSTEGKKDDAGATEDLTGQLDVLAKGGKKTKEITEELSEVIGEDATGGAIDFKQALIELKNQNPDKTFKELTPEVVKLAAAAKQAGMSVGEIKKAIEELESKDFGASFAKSLFGDTDFGKQVADSLEGILGGDFGKELGDSLGNGLMSGIQSVLNGGSITAALGDLAGTIGGTIGGSLFGPLGKMAGEWFGSWFTESVVDNVKDVFNGSSGEAIQSGIALGLDSIFPGVGSALDSAINSLFGGMFGNTNKWDEYRDRLETFIEDALKELDFESTVLLDGVNFQTPDEAFDPIINAAGEATNEISQTISAMQIPEEVHNSFNGLATLFATMFKIPKEDIDAMIGQFTKLLELNFQNAAGLNELQIILQGMGMTAENTQKLLTEAFMKGTLSAKEFLAAIAATQNLFEKGIPAAIGATNIAFQNLIENGLKDGAHALDAIGDIGAEALELVDENGNHLIQTLDDLKNNLLAAGYSVSDVDAFMQALAANGITSVEGLASATEIQAAGIISALQDAGFGFKDLEESIADVKEELDEIKSKEIDIKVNVQYESSGDVPPEDSEANVTPNRSSASYDTRALLNNSEFKRYDLGSLASGSRAGIDAMQRSAGVDLGNRNGEVSQLVNNVTINLDARGAQLGAAEQIKKELEKYFDKYNKTPGRNYY
jgi:hypothetical protein